MRAYIPDVVLARLRAEQTGWLAELRRVTVMFLNLTGLDFTASRRRWPRPRRHSQALARGAGHYEGSISKFSVDDKGTVLVAAFGLPPLAHEDDAARAVQAALAMQASLRQLGLRCAIGVTTRAGLLRPDRQRHRGASTP